MRATLYGGPGDITVGERPDPRLQTSADAVVRVTLGCVCGSDLWYRGVNPHALGSIGHEFIGVVEQVSADVTTLQPGDLVVAPFTFCDGTCANCAAGWPGNCLNGGSFGNHGVDGGQGEYVRVPYADATLVKVPGSGHSDAVMKSLAALSDVMCTGTTPRSAPASRPANSRHRGGSPDPPRRHRLTGTRVAPVRSQAAQTLWWGTLPLPLQQSLPAVAALMFTRLRLGMSCARGRGRSLKEPPWHTNRRRRRGRARS
jgi:hypothetical protein